LAENSGPLTDQIVRGLKPAAGRILMRRDGHPKSGGLVVRVFPSGEKRWAIRYRNGSGNQRMLTIGDALVVPLGGEGGARDLARQAQLHIANGRDPLEEKKARREADTVAELAEVYMERHAKAKKKSWKNDHAILEADVLPKWKNRAMREITKRDVRELLESIVDRGAAIHANRVHSLLGKMFSFACERDVVEHNVVRDIKKPSKERVRERVLTPDEIRAFWTATETMPLMLKVMWRVRLLTAQRPQEEVAQMQWGEVDLDSGWWVIPSSKAKNKLAHRVPLSAAVVALLREVQPAAPEAEDFVFAGYTRHAEARTGKHLPLAGFQPRDLRKTARTRMGEDGVPEEWAEAVLNHKKPGIVGVYNRHGFDREKRLALDHWARRVDAIVHDREGAKVLPFAQRA
jgi:integrase